VSKEKYYTRFELIFNYESKIFRAVLGIVEALQFPNERVILSENEAKQSAVLNGPRKREFEISRSLARLLIEEHFFEAEEELIDFEIKNSVFGQPIIMGSNIRSLGLSISHKPNLIGVVMFDRVHPVAIDIEPISIINQSVYRKFLTISEEDIMKEKHLSPIVFWTAKEALSKMIGSGITIPMDFLEIDNITCSGEVNGRYKHFKQYNFISLEFRQHIISIVYPKFSHLNISEI